MKDKHSDNHHPVDHLERLKEGNSTSRKYPDIEDTQIIYNDQVSLVKLVWDWNVKQNAGHIKSELKNIRDTAKKFAAFLKKSMLLVSETIICLT